jgi:hypothetical protein
VRYRLPVQLHHTQGHVVKDAETDQAVEAALEVDLLAHVALRELEYQIGDPPLDGTEVRDLGIAMGHGEYDPRKPAIPAMFQDVALMIVCRCYVLQRASGVRRVECFGEVERLQEVLLSVRVRHDVRHGKNAARAGDVRDLADDLPAAVERHPDEVLCCSHDLSPIEILRFLRIRGEGFQER